MAATDSHSFNWQAGPSVNLSFEYELSITLLTDSNIPAVLYKEVAENAVFI